MTEGATATRTAAVARAALVIALVGALAVAITWLPVGDRIVAVADALRALGPRGMAPFAAIYAVASLLLVPATPFPLSAGFLYGPWLGFLVAWSGEVLGAALAYALGRWLFRERIEALVLARFPTLAALDAALEEQGWPLLLLIRLSPLFPFGPLNYALGASGVRLRDYLFATALGVAPACLLLAYTGSTLPHLQAVLAGEERMGAGALLYWGGLVATIVAVLAVTRQTRRALARRIGDSPVP